MRYKVRIIGQTDRHLKNEFKMISNTDIIYTDSINTNDMFYEYANFKVQFKILYNNIYYVKNDILNICEYDRESFIPSEMSKFIDNVQYITYEGAIGIMFIASNSSSLSFMDFFINKHKEILNTGNIDNYELDYKKHVLESIEHIEEEKGLTLIQSAQFFHIKPKEFMSYLSKIGWIKRSDFRNPYLASDTAVELKYISVFNHKGYNPIGDDIRLQTILITKNGLRKLVTDLPFYLITEL